MSDDIEEYLEVLFPLPQLCKTCGLLKVSTRDECTFCILQDKREKNDDEAKGIGDS